MKELLFMLLMFGVLAIGVISNHPYSVPLVSFYLVYLVIMTGIDVMLSFYWGVITADENSLREELVKQRKKAATKHEERKVELSFLESVVIIGDFTYKHMYKENIPTSMMTAKIALSSAFGLFLFMHWDSAWSNILATVFLLTIIIRYNCIYWVFKNGKKISAALESAGKIHDNILEQQEESVK